MFKKRDVVKRCQLIFVEISALHAHMACYFTFSKLTKIHARYVQKGLEISDITVQRDWRYPKITSKGHI
jgi:hypothetical protein